jgi:hypothetical protein
MRPSSEGTEQRAGSGSLRRATRSTDRTGRSRFGVCKGGERMGVWWKNRPGWLKLGIQVVLANRPDNGSLSFSTWPALIGRR